MIDANVFPKWTRISQVRDVEFNFAARGIVRSSSLHVAITSRAKVAGNSRTNGGVIKVILRPSGRRESLE